MSTNSFGGLNEVLEIDRIRPKQRTPTKTHINILRHGTGVALQKRVWTFPKILNRTELQMRRHGNNEEGKGAAQKGFETSGCRYFMWNMVTKLKHVQQAAANLTIPTK